MANDSVVTVQADPVTRTCLVCGQRLKLRNKSYCSMRCRDIPTEISRRAMGHRPWNYAQVELICEVCRRPFKVPPAHQRRRRRCSKICDATARRQIPVDHFRCHRCHVIFPKSETYSPTKIVRGRGWSYCKPCHKQRNWEHRQRHKERIGLRQRDHLRANYIRTTGRVLKVKKRPWPLGDVCELCTLGPRRLGYHHWDDSKPEFGMWICVSCHKAAHWLERFDPSIYWTLRSRVSTESSES
jgi:hypothetical protein